MPKKTREEKAAEQALQKSKKAFWQMMEENQVDAVRAFLQQDAASVNREDGRLVYKRYEQRNQEFERDVTITHRYLSPVQYAAAHGQTEMVRMLIPLGADLNDASEANYTALGYARMFGYYECEIVLMEAHAARLHPASHSLPPRPARPY